MKTPTKIKINRFHQIVRAFVEGYLSAINLDDYVMSEEDIRNCPILTPPLENEGIRISIDTFGKLFVTKVEKRLGTQNYTTVPLSAAQSWTLTKGPGRHLRINLLRSTLKTFWEDLETTYLKRLPKTNLPLLRGQSVADKDDFSRLAEEQFRKLHKLEITVVKGLVVFSGRHCYNVFGWRKVRQ